MGVFDGIGTFLDGIGSMAGEVAQNGLQYLQDAASVAQAVQTIQGASNAGGRTPGILPEPVGARGYASPVGPGLAGSESTATTLLTVAALGLLVYLAVRSGR